MINLVMDVIFNLSDGNSTGWFYYAMEPFGNVLGGLDFFFAFLVLLITGMTYIGSDHNTFTTSIILLVFSGLFVAVLPSIISMLILVFAGLIVTFMLYKTFVERKVNP